MKAASISFAVTVIFFVTISAAAADKVVVIPLGSNASINSAGGKLWSTGRPGTGLMTHSDPNGYCTSNTGIKYALSVHMIQWGSIADVCPSGTWVCSENDLPIAADSCPISSIATYSGRMCDGSVFPATPQQKTSAWAYVADATPDDTQSARMVYSETLAAGSTPSCFSYRAWCCWQ